MPFSEGEKKKDIEPIISQFGQKLKTMFCTSSRDGKWK